MRNAEIALLALSLALSLGSLAQLARSQAPRGGPETKQEDPLARPAPNFQSPFASVSMAFQTLMLESGTPGGEVTLEGCEGESQRAVRLEGPTVREALEGITRADPQFRWEVKEGVIHLLPIGGVPSLLKVRIKGFDTGEATDIETAATFLFALQDVRDAAATLGLSRNAIGTGPYAIIPGPHPEPPRLGLHLRDLTVADALDALVRTNKRGIWLYREIDCGRAHLFDLNTSQ